jgi:hypothetical protein
MNGVIKKGVKSTNDIEGCSAKGGIPAGPTNRRRRNTDMYGVSGSKRAI